jgi:hypothetical protein
MTATGAEGRIEQFRRLFRRRGGLQMRMVEHATKLEVSRRRLEGFHHLTWDLALVARRNHLDGRRRSGGEFKGETQGL